MCLDFRADGRLQDQAHSPGGGMGFIFYDTETTGTDSRYDQILQFAAIHTDDELREIDSINLRCRIKPYLVPSPGAMMVTRISPDDLISPPLSHYEMISEVRRWLLDRSPAVFTGHNSIGFDEGFLRQAFYKSLLPLYLTNTSGSTRADTMRIAQAAHIMSPGTIDVPLNERGNPAFKLGLLVRANGIVFAEDDAHDALADVRATIALARLLRARSPLVWSHMIETGSKARANALLKREPACICAEVHFGRPVMRVITACAAMPGNDANWVGFDLTHDPEPYLGLNPHGLRSELTKKGRRSLHLLRTNNQPMLLPIDAAPALIEQAGLNHLELASRAARIRANQNFLVNLQAALEGWYEDDAEPSTHVEERIYDGFPSRHDERLQERFSASSWADRMEICRRFEDRRFSDLGLRLFFCDRPQQLSAETKQDLAARLAERALSKDLEVPWNTVAKARLELDELRTRMPLPPQTARLDEIDAFLVTLENRFRRWSSGIVEDSIPAFTVRDSVRT